ncbi:protein shisa-9 isoform X1 [Gracilinanus agilis]|uniref:protein shisa-9 isoform X1 n=1 Tax=Gracilinanus agilis TaxID=191870 RepID=UPI001CFC6344|nr:protein shisa-9 isoform X1 [Gracilinanus agilis]
MCGSWRLAAPGSLGSFSSSSGGGGSGGGSSGSVGCRAAEPRLGDTMRRVLRLLLGCCLTELCARVCRAQERSGQGQLHQQQQQQQHQHLDNVVVLSGGNRSGAADPGEAAGASEAAPTKAPTPDSCRGYFDVMGQWDPPFNCSSGDFIFCCGTCGFRFCCTFKKRRLNQSTCTNYDTPLWLNTGKPPARKDDPLHDPTKDKTNLIVYIICGVVAVMVLVGIFTKLGLEKAHRPQREHMSRALADVMRPQGHCTTDHMERDLNIVVHVQHYENMDTRAPVNNLHATQLNNAVPTSPLLPQMSHPHSYPSLGQISNPYEQQPPGKELNKYASLKAVGSCDGDWAVTTLKSPKADKVNDDFYSKRRHLAELAAKGSLPLHPVRVEEEPPRAFSPEHGPTKQNGQKSRVNKLHTHPLAYNSTTNFKGWDPNEPSLRRQAYGNKGKLGTAEPTSSEPLATRSQHFMPSQPYFITNSKTEVTV